MANIKCINNPIDLGLKLASKLENSEFYPLKSTTDLINLMSNELINSQSELATLTKEQLATRKDRTGMSSFLSEFEGSFKEELEFVIEDETDPERRGILEEALTMDISDSVVDNFRTFFISNKYDAVDEDLPAADESLNELIDATKLDADDLEVDEYTKYLLNLSRRYLSSSKVPVLTTVSPTELALDFANFIDSTMYLAMLDTSADGANTGFTGDPEILKEKLLENVTEIINNSPDDLQSIDIFKNDDKTITQKARNVLFANIVVKNINPLSEKLFKFEGYKWTADFDSQNISSDSYLDKLSELILNNSPRLIKVEDGVYKVDPLNPTISSREMKNLVLTELINAESNTLEGIRKALADNKNPVVEAVYQYYFADNSDGYMLSLGGKPATKHYSFAHAVTQAKKEAYGKNAIPKTERKYSGFDSVNSDLFKNRIISTFVSIQAADRIKLVDGKLIFASDSFSAVKLSYTSRLINSMSHPTDATRINPEIIKAVRLHKVDGSKNTVRIVIKNPETKAVLLDTNFKLKLGSAAEFTPDDLKGRIGTIDSKTATGTVDTRSDDYKNTIKALEILGFNWASDNNFIVEYEKQIKEAVRADKASLKNFAANLAMTAVINSASMRVRLEAILPKLKGIKPVVESTEETIDTDVLKYNPIEYIHDFLGLQGDVSSAMDASFNVNTALDYKSQDGERVAATVAATLNAKKNKVIKSARRLLKDGKETVLEGNNLVGSLNEDGTFKNAIYKLGKRAVKEGVDVQGKNVLLSDMSTQDRTIALIEMGLASMVKSKESNLRHVIIQPHLYSDKKSIEVFEVESTLGALVTASKDGLNAEPIINRIIENNKRKYNNLGRSINSQWKKVLSDPITQHFIGNKNVDIDAFFKSNKTNSIKKLNDFIISLDLNADYISKNTGLVLDRDVVIKKENNELVVKGIKDTSIKLQEIWNKPDKAKALLKHHNRQFLAKLFAQSGKNSDLINLSIREKITGALGLEETISDTDAAYLYHLLNLELSPQIEELSIGDDSQFSGDISNDIDFSRVQNNFKTLAEYKEFIEFQSLALGQSQQLVTKTKRAGLLETNGIFLSLLEADEFGEGVGRNFYSTTISDPKVAAQILTDVIDDVDNYDGIRIGLDIVRRQINSSLGGDAAMSSKGEAHKDGYNEYDPALGTSRTQKMSTMYMTPEFIRNSTESYKLIKRMLTAIPYPADTEFIMPGQSSPRLAYNAWDVVMAIQQQFNVALDSDVLWNTFQEIESQNPHIRGKYISYITFETAEKTGSTGLESSDTFVNHTEFSAGDKFQWNTPNRGNNYEEGTVKEVHRKNAKAVEKANKNLVEKKNNLLEAIVKGEAYEVNQDIEPLFTAAFVNTDEILAKYPTTLENTFAHHSTIDFKPKNLEGIPVGETTDLKIIGRLTTDEVDVLLVDNPYSSSENPHITLATAEGIKPFQSNKIIEEAIKTKDDRLERFEDTIPAVYGYENFDNETIIEPKFRSDSDAIRQEIATSESLVDMYQEMEKDMDSNPYMKIYNSIPKLNIENVEKETGVNVGNSQDIANIWVSKTSKTTIERAAEKIFEASFSTEDGSYTAEIPDEQAVRNIIIEAIQVPKADFIASISKKEDIKSLKEQIGELKGNLAVVTEIEKSPIHDELREAQREFDLAVAAGVGDTRLVILKKLDEGVVEQQVLISENNDAMTLDVVEGQLVKTPISSLHKSFNYSKLDYSNHSVILNAGKDAEYKGGVAKMTQALNSVLFNDSYIKDALNLVHAQGTMAESNINKLKEEFSQRAYEAVMEATEIKGVDTKTLNRVQGLLNNKLVSKGPYDKNQEEIKAFFSLPEVQRLGYKNFVVENSKNSNIDPDLFEQIKQTDYSFSGSSTNLMFKVFSSAIENETIKVRYAGNNFILSPAEDMLKPYNYKGTTMLRGDLIKHIIKEKQDVKVHELEPEQVPLMSLLLKDSDVIVQKISGYSNRIMTVGEFIDSKINPTVDETTYDETERQEQRQKATRLQLLASLQDPSNKLSVIKLSDYNQRKLEHTEVTDKAGQNIKDTVEYESYIHFKKGADSSKTFSRGVFNIYKNIADTETFPEYDFFRNFDSYESYLAYQKSPEGKAVYLSPILSTSQTVNKLLWEIDKNLITIDGKSKLHKPIVLNVFDPGNEFNSIEDLISPENLVRLKEVLKENGLTSKSAFTLIKVNDPKQSSTHATAQENAVNSIDLLEIAHKNLNIDLRTPAKESQSDLITELRSTIDGGPKYSSSFGEVVIPFVNLKEFGIKPDKFGANPTLIDIIGQSTTEEESIKNANEFFSKSSINFPTFDLQNKKNTQLDDESTVDFVHRILLKYKKDLEDQKAVSMALANDTDTYKLSLIDYLLRAIDSAESVKDTDERRYVKEVNKLSSRLEDLIDNSKYAADIRGKRAKSFVNYLKIFYGRIPGTGLQTNGTAKIIGFIQDMGNTSFLDTFNSVISGSDFDIDKITTMLRAIDSNGIEYSYDPWIDVEEEVNGIAQELSKDWSEVNSLNIQELAKTINSDKFKEEIDRLSENLRDNLFSFNNNKESKKDRISNGDIDIKVAKFRKSYRRQFERAMQNYILDQLKNITKGVNVQFEAQTMVTMDGVDSSKKKLINKRLDVALTPNQKAYFSNTFSPYDLHSKMKLESENAAGTMAIGMYANAQKNLGIITHSVNTKKLSTNPKVRDNAGKFKIPIVLHLERSEQEGGNTERKSVAIANSQDINPISAKETIALKKAINDIRTANPNLSISELYTMLNSGVIEDAKYGTNIKQAWEKKIKELTADQGWEAIGQFIQSATDNAKALHLGPIGATEDTNSFFSFAMIAGFNIADTVEFLSNPKIKAISTLYNNFSKENYTPFDLKILFGDNIPQEYKLVFNLQGDNTIVTRWPSKLTEIEEGLPSIEDLNAALLKRSTKEQKKLYMSFSQIIEGEMELRVLSSMIGLDVSHPNSLLDTTNKMRTIGSAMLRILKRNGGQSEFKDVSPIALVRMYTTNTQESKEARNPASKAAFKKTSFLNSPNLRNNIDYKFAQNVNFIDALDIIKDHDAFTTYLNSLGFKMEVTENLSFIPKMMSLSKFSGMAPLTFKENKDIEKILYGFSVRSYLKNANSDAKHIKLNTSDKVYNLTKDKDLKDFIRDFPKDIEDLNKKYKSSLFDMFKFDTDPNREKDVSVTDRYLSLLLGNNSDPKEIAFLKASIDELKSDTATEDQKNFYKNLQLYSLIVEGGLAPKNGLFQFLQLDMPEYNKHLADLNNDSDLISQLEELHPISIQLNALHLAKVRDTNLKKKKKKSKEEAYYDAYELDGQMQDDPMQDDLMNQKEAFGKKKEYRKADPKINQWPDLYTSLDTNRVYYSPLKRSLGHIIVSPSISKKGRLLHYDSRLDPVLNGGWQYGVKVKNGDKDIFILKANNNSDNNSYYYINDQIKFSKALKDVQNILEDPKLDGEYVARIVEQFIATIPTISDLQLIKSNPNWIFKKNEVRKIYKKEVKNMKYFNPIKSGSILPDQLSPVAMDVKLINDKVRKAEGSQSNKSKFDKVVKSRLEDTLRNFSLSNKAIISGAENGSGVFIEAAKYKDNQINIKTTRDFNYKDTDVVAVVIDPNMTVPGRVTQAIKKGAIILTPKVTGRNTKSDVALIKQLTNRNYIEVKNGVWMKDNPIKAQKESTMVPTESYTREARKISKRIFSNVIGKLLDIFPNIDIEILSSNEIKMDPNLGEAFMSHKGFVYKGVVYLNSDKMTLDTPLHEFGHIFMADLKQTDPSMYSKIVQDSLNHEFAERVRKAYPELSEEELGEEIFVEALGMHSSSLVTSTPLNTWIKAMKDWLIKTFPKIFPNKNLKPSLDDTLNTIIEKVGHKLVFESDVMSNLSSQEHDLWMAGSKPSMSYAMIENNLIEQGFIKKICSFSI